MSLVSDYDEDEYPVEDDYEIALERHRGCPHGHLLQDCDECAIEKHGHTDYCPHGETIGACCACDVEGDVFLSHL